MSAGLHGPFSFLLQCYLFSFAYDIVLGLDWAGHFRDSLTHISLRPGPASALDICFPYLNPPMPLVSRSRWSLSPAVRLPPANIFLGLNLLLFFGLLWLYFHSTPADPLLPLLGPAAVASSSQHTEPVSLHVHPDELLASSLLSPSL
ncbi:hypothetical protein DFH09DRAFT_1106990 [Mycena vulgaris]|nr:hypothetical protein DFH09DRAFT_1106990 [Mycena vulgaris]